jgi:hypothetical protein
MLVTTALMIHLLSGGVVRSCDSFMPSFVHEMLYSEPLKQQQQQQ